MLHLVGTILEYKTYPARKVYEDTRLTQQKKKKTFEQLILWKGWWIFGFHNAKTTYVQVNAATLRISFFFVARRRQTSPVSKSNVTPVNSTATNMSAAWRVYCKYATRLCSVKLHNITKTLVLVWNEQNATRPSEALDTVDCAPAAACGAA